MCFTRCVWDNKSCVLNDERLWTNPEFEMRFAYDVMFEICGNEAHGHTGKSADRGFYVNSVRLSWLRCCGCGYQERI